MKKILTGLLMGLSVLMFAAIPTLAAETETALSLLNEGAMVSVFFDAEREENFTEQEACLYALLKNGIEQYTESIDIREAGYSDIGELCSFVEETLNVEILWNRVSGKIRLSSEEDTGLITHILFNYPDAEIVNNNALYMEAQSLYSSGKGTVIQTIEQGVAHAMACVKDSMSDIEKALVLHDYLVREVDYGFDDKDDCYGVKGALVNRLAVCNGYALAYSRLLQECGISSYVVGSDAMDHAWNLVKINGNWYHVDVTWDDPTNQRGGYVSHTFFMRSDTEMLNHLEHYAWGIQNSLQTTPKASVSGSFVGYAFRDETDTVQPSGGIPVMNECNGYYYYLDNVWGSSVMYRSKIDGSDKTKINLDYWVRFLFLFGEKLYANTNNRVYELSLDGKILRTVAVSDEKIINFWLKLDQLVYEVQLDDGSTTTHIVDTVNGAKNYLVSGDFEYTINGKNLVVLKYNGSDANVIVPEKVNDYTVTAIGASAFSENNAFSSVVLPDTVTRIGDGAFSQCYSLNEIDLGNGLRRIDAGAFWNCYSLNKIIFPSTLEYLGDNAFEYTQWLSELYFLGEVPSFWGAHVFGGWNGDNGESKRIYYIADHSSWKTFPGEDGYTKWTDKHGTAYTTFAYFSSEEYEYALNGENLIVLKYNGNDNNVTVPQTINGYPVTEIGVEAFSGNETITSVILPDTITVIGEKAFFQCGSLAEIDLGESVTRIESHAFWNCYVLKQITLPFTLEYLGDYSFEYTFCLETVEFWGEVPEYWGERVFDCNSDQLGDTVFHYISGRSSWKTVTDQYGSTTWTDKNGVVYSIASFLPFILGDLSNDAVLTTEDSDLFAQYFAGWYSEMPFPTEKADINGDGKVTFSDRMLFSRRIAGWPLEN